MPQATNLTIKNAADVDKTFALLSPASGDGGIATWRLEEGDISAVFPTLTASASPTKRGRSMKIKFYVPSSYTDSVTGLTNVGSRAEVNATVSMPNDFPVAKKADFVAFTANIMNAALIKACMSDAAPAT